MSKAKLTAENDKSIEVEITDYIDWDNDDYDNYRYDTGNYYETEALALKDIAKFRDYIEKYFGGNE